jgi:hypothetical protein
MTHWQLLNSIRLYVLKGAGDKADGALALAQL